MKRSMNRSLNRSLVAGAFTLVLAACPATEPTELVPTFNPLTGLPGLPPPSGPDEDCVADGWCLDVETLSLRNVGTRTVTISDVRFADDSDAAFTALESSTLEVGPDEQANLRFRYSMPTGDAVSATIVIESDAEVNPTLEIPVETNAYTGGGDEDAGPTDEDAGDSDAG